MWTEKYEHAMNRRQFLNQLGSGFGSLALAGMLGEEGLLASTTQPGTGAAVGVLHHPPKAKRVVQLFMGGAASHLDLFDYKPALEKHHGKKSDFGEHVEAFQNGFVIEKVEMTGRPAHEELHDSLGFGWMMQHFDGTADTDCLRSGQQPAVPQHPRQSESTESTTKLIEKLSAIHVSVFV